MAADPGTETAKRGGGRPQDRSAALAEALGLKRAKLAPPGRRRKDAPSCQDCFFHRNLLCALDLEEACSTFRRDTSDGLVPPRQPALLIRDA